MKFKKIIAVITLAVMAASLGACDSGSSKSNNDNNKSYGGYSQDYWDSAKKAWDENK